MNAQSIDEWDEYDNEPDTAVIVEGSEGLDEISGLPLDARRALTKLLMSRYVTRSRNRRLWDAILANKDEIADRLADMFLDLEIDTDYEAPSSDNR